MFFTVIWPTKKATINIYLLVLYSCHTLTLSLLKYLQHYWLFCVQWYGQCRMCGTIFNTVVLHFKSDNKCCISNIFSTDNNVACYLWNLSTSMFQHGWMHVFIFYNVISVLIQYVWTWTIKGVIYVNFPY